MSTEPPASLPDDELPPEEVRARDLVATPVPPLAATEVDRLVARALEDAPPIVVPRPSATRWRGPAPWQVAAAVVLLVSIGLALVYTGRDQGDEVASTGAGDAPALETAEEAEPPADEAATADADGGTEAFDLPAHGAPTTTAPGADGASGAARLPVPYLGAFAGPDDLRRALADGFAADAELPAGIAAPSDASVDRCDDQVQIVLDTGAAAITRGFALVDDLVVLVYEYDRASFADGSPTTLVVAVGIDACQQVVAFER
jgi:hypothetical protein